MNSVCLVGALTRAPVTRFEGAGSQVTTFPLAVVETRAEKAWTLYVPCVAWGRVAETCSLFGAEDLLTVRGVTRH